MIKLEGILYPENNIAMVCFEPIIRLGNWPPYKEKLSPLLLKNNIKGIVLYKESFGINYCIIFDSNSDFVLFKLTFDFDTSPFRRTKEEFKKHFFDHFDLFYE